VIHRGGDFAVAIVSTAGVEKDLCAARVGRYLEGLAAACLETARNPRLLGVLLGVLRLAPRTIVELARAPGG
jgi:hypothetical protein